MAEHWIDTCALAGFDLETTSKYATQARPITAALVLDGDAGHENHPNYPLLINPGVPIPAESVEIHGVTNDQASKGTPLPDALITIVEALAEVAGRGYTITGANIKYDLTVLEWNCQRNGITGLFARTPQARILDGMLLDHWWNRYRPGPARGGVARNLAGLCEHYGVELGAAHDCTADAVAAVHLARAVLRRTTLDDEDLGKAATGGWEQQRITELRSCVNIEDLFALQRTWAHDQAANREAYERSRGSVDHREDRNWPVQPYRARPTHGRAFAEQWIEEHRASLDARAVEGTVAMGPDELHRLLADAFDAGLGAADEG